MTMKVTRTKLPANSTRDTTTPHHQWPPLRKCASRLRPSIIRPCRAAMPPCRAEMPVSRAAAPSRRPSPATLPRLDGHCQLLDSGRLDSGRRATGRAAHQADVIELDILSSISGVGAEAWDALTGDDDPFLEYGFLNALELSESVGEAAGCVPRLVVVRAGGR